MAKQLKRVTFYLYIQQQLNNAKGQRLFLPYKEAKQVLNKWHNVPDKFVCAILKELELLDLVKIEGRFNNMKVRIKNISKAKILYNPSKLNKTLGLF